MTSRPDLAAEQNRTHRPLVTSDLLVHRLGTAEGSQIATTDAAGRQPDDRVRRFDDPWVLGLGSMSWTTATFGELALAYGELAITAEPGSFVGGAKRSSATIGRFDDTRCSSRLLSRRRSPMSRTISVGELRQNPTRMLREVKAGASYTVTDHGEPIAEIVARRQPRWIPGDEIDCLLRELGGEDAWAGEIAAERAAVEVVDPWESAE